MSAEDSKHDNIDDTQIEDPVSKDFKLQDGHIKPKEYKLKLPNVLIKNIDYLQRVEKFLRKNNIQQDLFDSRDEFEQDEWEDLCEIVQIFEELMEVIEAYNNQEEFVLTAPATKINRLKRLSASYI